MVVSLADMLFPEDEQAGAAGGLGVMGGLQSILGFSLSGSGGDQLRERRAQLRLGRLAAR